MAHKLRIGAVEFEVGPVPSATAEVVLKDPLIQPGVWRRVYSWDGETGRVRVRTTANGAVPLPNGVLFFMPRTAEGGAVIRDEEASANMGRRVVEATGAPDLEALMKAVSGTVQLPQKTVPLDRFEPLEPVVAFDIRQHLDYVPVRLRNKAEDLTLYLCLPNRVSYHHEITRVLDQAGFDALMADRPELRNLQPDFIVPARSRANAGLRRLGLEQRRNDLRRLRAALPEGAGGSTAGANLDAMLARTEQERDALSAALKQA